MDGLGGEVRFLLDTGLLPEEAKSHERVSWAQEAGRVSKAWGEGSGFRLTARLCPGIAGQPK